MITFDQPIDVPPDVALPFPEPDAGGLPVLNPPELLELGPLGLLELLGAWEPAEVPALDLPARPSGWTAGTPGGREMPAPESTPTACPAEPGRTSAKAPVAAIPPTPAMAVSRRTVDRP
jgi:hypothetical protein